MERKQGGQPGNQNARTHGFYSKVLVDSQKDDFEQAVLVDGLDEEIAMLRVKIKALLERDPDNMKLIGQAVKILSGLITARFGTRADDPDRLQRAFQNIIDNIASPMGVDFIDFLKK